MHKPSPCTLLISKPFSIVLHNLLQCYAKLPIFHVPLACIIKNQIDVTQRAQDYQKMFKKRLQNVQTSFSIILYNYNKFDKQQLYNRSQRFGSWNDQGFLTVYDCKFDKFVVGRRIFKYLRNRKTDNLKRCVVIL